MGHILGQLIEIVEHLLDGIRRHLDIVATPSICHAKFTIVEHKCGPLAAAMRF